jgi:hypothetical protein
LEYLFSPRRIVLSGESVQWDCSCVEWTEDIEYDNELRGIINHSNPFDNPLSIRVPDTEKT